LVLKNKNGIIAQSKYISLFMAQKLTFNQAVSNHSAKWAKKKEAFFKKYNNALSKSKMTKLDDINAFWSEKYKPTFDGMMEKMQKEYAKIWHKYQK